MQPILQLRSDDLRTLWAPMYSCVRFSDRQGTIVTHSEAASTSNPKPEAGS
jgi:hypothetical protein